MQSPAVVQLFSVLREHAAYTARVGDKTGVGILGRTSRMHPQDVLNPSYPLSALLHWLFLLQRVLTPDTCLLAETGEEHDSCFSTQPALSGNTQCVHSHQCGSTGTEVSYPHNTSCVISLPGSNLRVTTTIRSVLLVRITAPHPSYSLILPQPACRLVLSLCLFPLNWCCPLTQVTHGSTQ